MLIYSLTPTATRDLNLGMAAILLAYSVYYALDREWLVVAGALAVAAALLVLGGTVVATGAHPRMRVVTAAMVLINLGAVAGITGLAVEGIVWIAPLVFVNFLLGGVRGGAGVTIVSVAFIVALGDYLADIDLALNILGAVVLSLLMATAYAGAMRAHFTRLRSEALHDPLTGLLNRRAFERDLGERLANAAGPVSVVFLDLDHFKQLNDRFGHPAGDTVLKRFAGIVTAQLRRTDRLYRYGGEEFLLLLETPAHEALRVAEKVRAAVAAEQLHPEFVVTVSGGIAEAGSGEGGRALLRRADRALYAAKSAGRNRCAISDGERPMRLGEHDMDTELS